MHKKGGNRQETIFSIEQLEGLSPPYAVGPMGVVALAVALRCATDQGIYIFNLFIQFLFLL